MNFKKVSSAFLLFNILILLSSITLFAQNNMTEYEIMTKKLEEEANKLGVGLLPNIKLEKVMNTGVKISWYNQYNKIDNIAIQKSTDSIQNFKTVGYLKNSMKGLNFYADNQLTPGKFYYRLLIVFNSDLNWYSNIKSIVIDSSLVLATKSANSKSINLGIIPNTNNSITIKPLDKNVLPAPPNYVDPAKENFVFKASENIFVDPFSQQIMVNIIEKNTQNESVSISFIDPITNKILNKIKKAPLQKFVIDKKNFQKSGLIKFEVSKNKKIVDSGFILLQ